MSKPRNIVLLIADSLRYDSVHAGGDARLPYITANGATFTQARSGGCWTLPATASLFTGLMPHEHGADAQTRGLHTDVVTLAERMKARGYRTIHITANVATTEVFGLDRGFDEMHRIWQLIPAHYQKIHELLVLVGKPRLRKQILTTDFVMGKLSEDIEAGKVWLQSTNEDVFALARQKLAEAEKDGQPCFLFLNLMETHFPYHIDETFSFMEDGIVGKMQEIVALYHLVNQTWLTTGEQPIDPKMMVRLKERQRRAWARLAPRVDAFVQEMHGHKDTTVVFGSDHGDNFGEQGWAYHFSNVTDAGNRVPLFWLRADESAGKTVDTPVSSRDVFQGLLKEAGDPQAAFHIADEPEASFPIMQSCWYNNQNRTLPRFRYNQICYFEGGTRWLNRSGEWYSAPPASEAGEEAPFVRIAGQLQPLEELNIPPERRTYLKNVNAAFERFSQKIMEKA
jgi:arylsulfatase A-like enzyme